MAKINLLNSIPKIKRNFIIRSKKRPRNTLKFQKFGKNILMEKENLVMAVINMMVDGNLWLKNCSSL